jgi:phage major head subunit gpT-like protein
MKTKPKKLAPNNIPPTGDVEFSGVATFAALDPVTPGPKRFDMVAYTGGAIRPHNPKLQYPVVVDLAGLDITKQRRPALKDHDQSLLVGHTDRIETDGKQLTASGVISGSGNSAREVSESAANGFEWQVSMGVEYSSLEFVQPRKTIQANGRSFNGPIYVARRSRVMELSFLTLGADDDTSARIAAGAAKDNAMTFEEWLADNGFQPEKISDKQRMVLQAAFDSDGEDDEDDDGQDNPIARRQSGDLDTVLAPAREKKKRQQEIVNLTAKALQDSPEQLKIIEAMSTQAFNGDWDAQRYELELLRAIRPQANQRVRGSNDDGLNNAVIEAALCVAGGIEKPEDHYSEQTLEAAHKRFRHGLGLEETLLLFARRNGHEGLSTRNLAPTLRAAFAEPAESHYLQASGISTLSLPGILSNVANKFLKMGFDSVETSWRAIAAIRSVRDFKQVSSYSLTGDFEYIELAPGGQLKHAEAGEVSYTNQAKTYGRMFGIDRRDIINDDLGALTQVPRRLGRGGALKFNLVFWMAFMNNSSFFAAGENNYFEGAATNLQISSLTTAETKFLDQTDEDGKPLAVTPRILLVPNALAVTASQLMRDTNVGNTTDNTVYTTGNPHAGKFTVVRSSYLSSTAITGNSTTAWYLLADPNDVPVIEAAFLNGVESPTVEQADADFNQLGIQMRGYHDFGVALQEPKGGVKSKGAA